MDREEARRRAEIMIAFANGNDVQFYNRDTKQWEDIRPECVLFEPAAEYRVKPEPKYRPFESQEECWNEMLKHQPFGWIRSNISGILYLIESVSDEMSFNKLFISYEDAFECSEFADGTPFGIKEE